MVRVTLLALFVALAVALPASAATPIVKGTVGPGFTITGPKKGLKAGKTTFVIADKSNIHNFHLIGPGGVNVLTTTVPEVGVKKFTVTLKKGTYRFVCDPHLTSMKGSFKVS